MPPSISPGLELELDFEPLVLEPGFTPSPPPALTPVAPTPATGFALTPDPLSQMLKPIKKRCVQLNIDPPHMHLGSADPNPAEPKPSVYVNADVDGAGAGSTAAVDMDVVLNVVHDRVYRADVIRRLVNPSPTTSLEMMVHENHPETSMDKYLSKDGLSLDCNSLWHEAEAADRAQTPRCSRPSPAGSSSGLDPMDVLTSPVGAILSLPTKLNPSRSISIEYSYLPAVLLSRSRFQLACGKTGLVMDGVAYLSENRRHIPLGRILPLSGVSSDKILKHCS